MDISNLEAQAVEAEVLDAEDSVDDWVPMEDFDEAADLLDSCMVALKSASTIKGINPHLRRKFAWLEEDVRNFLKEHYGLDEEVSK